MSRLSDYILEAIGLTLSVAVSIIITLSAQIFLTGTDSQLSLLIGLSTLLIGITITNYINSEQEFGDISEEINEIRDFSSDFSELQEYPDSRQRFQRIAENFVKATDEHKFFKQRAEDRLGDFEHEMARLGDGRFRCNADSRMEPDVTRKLLKCTENTIKAVSYDGEDWWLGDSGQQYMKTHEKLLENKDVEIFRIFITPESKRKDMEEVFEWHRQNGIHHAVIDPEKFDKPYLDSVGEFVIYDEKLLRKGEITKGRQENDILVTTSQSRIDKKMEDFTTLAMRTEDIANLHR